MSLNNSVNQEGRKSPKRRRSALSAALRRPFASFLHSVSVNFTSHFAPQRTLRRHFSAGFSLLTIALLFFAVGALSADSRRESQTPGGFLYSQYLQEAGYAASGSDQISVGTFAVNIPHSFLLMDGRRIAERVGNAIDALPLQHWLMDYYLEEDADISSRGIHQAARTGWDIAGQATDEAVLILTEPAREIGFVRNIGVDLQSELGGRFAQVALNAIGALRETDQEIVAWQLRGYFGQDDNSGGREGLNAGLIYRRAVQDDTALFGMNTFLDYETYKEEDFLRWSGGAEFRTAHADVYANYYSGMSDPVISVGENNQSVAIYSADGYEAGVNVRIPDVPWLSVIGEYYVWQGQYGREDVSGFRPGIRFHPPGIPVSVEVAYQDGEDGDNVGARFSFLLEREFGKSATSSQSSPAGFRAQDLFYLPVRRQYSQRIYETSIGPGGSPFGIVGLSPAGSTISVRVSPAPGSNDPRTDLVVVDSGNVDPRGVILNGVLEGVTLPADITTRRAYPWRLPAGSVTVYTQSSAGGQSAVTLTYEQGGNSGTLQIFSTVVLLPNAQPLLLHGKVSVAAESGEIVIRTPEREIRITGAVRGGGASVILERTSANQEIYTPVPDRNIGITLVGSGNASIRISEIEIPVDSDGNPRMDPETGLPVVNTMAVVAADFDCNSDVSTPGIARQCELETPVMGVNAAYDDENLFGDSVDISQDGNRIRITYLETTNLPQSSEPIATLQVRGGSGGGRFLSFSVPGLSFNTGSGELRLDHANNMFPDEVGTVLITATVVVEDTDLNLDIVDSQQISLVFTVEVVGERLDPLVASFAGAANNSSASGPYPVTGFFTEANVIATAQVTAGTGAGYNYAFSGTPNSNIQLNTDNGQITLGPAANNSYAEGDLFTVTIIANDGDDPDDRTEAQMLTLYLSVAAVDYPDFSVTHVAGGSRLSGAGTSADPYVSGRRRSDIATITPEGSSGQYRYSIINNPGNRFVLSSDSGGSTNLRFANDTLPPQSGNDYQAVVQVRAVAGSDNTVDTENVVIRVRVADAPQIGASINPNSSYQANSEDTAAPTSNGIRIEVTYREDRTINTADPIANLEVEPDDTGVLTFSSEDAGVDARQVGDQWQLFLTAPASPRTPGTYNLNLVGSVNENPNDPDADMEDVALEVVLNVVAVPAIVPSFGVATTEQNPREVRADFSQRVAVATISAQGGSGAVTYSVTENNSGLEIDNDVIYIAQRTASQALTESGISIVFSFRDTFANSADVPAAFYVNITGTNYPNLNVAHATGHGRITGEGIDGDPYVTGRRRSNIATITPTGSSEQYRYSIVNDSSNRFVLSSDNGASTNLRFANDTLPPQGDYQTTVQVRAVAGGNAEVGTYNVVIHVQVGEAPTVGASINPNSSYQANSEDTAAPTSNGIRIEVTYREDRTINTTDPIANVEVEPAATGILSFSSEDPGVDARQVGIQWQLFLTAPAAPRTPGTYTLDLVGSVAENANAGAATEPVEFEVVLNVVAVPTIVPSFGVVATEQSPLQARADFSQRVAVATISAQGGSGTITRSVTENNSALEIENDVIYIAQRTASQAPTESGIFVVFSFSDNFANSADVQATFYVDITGTDYPDVNLAVAGSSGVTGDGTQSDPYEVVNTDIATFTPSGGSGIYQYGFLPVQSGTLVITPDSSGDFAVLRFGDSVTPVINQVYVVTVEARSVADNGNHETGAQQTIIYIRAIIDVTDTAAAEQAGDGTAANPYKVTSAVTDTQIATFSASGGAGGYTYSYTIEGSNATYYEIHASTGLLSHTGGSQFPAIGTPDQVVVRATDANNGFAETTVYVETEFPAIQAALTRQPLVPAGSGTVTTEPYLLAFTGTDVAQVQPTGGSGAYQYSLSGSNNDNYEISDTGLVSHKSGAGQPPDAGTTPHSFVVRVDDEHSDLNMELNVYVGWYLGVVGTHQAGYQVFGTGTRADPYQVTEVAQGIADISGRGGGAGLNPDDIFYAFSFAPGFDPTFGTSANRYDIADDSGIFGHAYQQPLPPKETVDAAVIRVSLSGSNPAEFYDVTIYVSLGVFATHAPEGGTAGSGRNRQPYVIANAGDNVAQIVPGGGVGTNYGYSINPANPDYEVSNTGLLRHIATAELPTGKLTLTIRVTDEKTPTPNYADVAIVLDAAFGAGHTPGAGVEAGNGTSTPYQIDDLGATIATVFGVGGDGTYAISFAQAGNPGDRYNLVNGVLSHDDSQDLPAEGTTDEVMVVVTEGGGESSMLVIHVSRFVPLPIAGNIVRTGPTDGYSQYRDENDGSHPTRYRARVDTYAEALSTLNADINTPSDEDFFITFHVPEWDNAGYDYTMEAVQITHPSGLPVTENQFTLSVLADGRHRLLFAEEPFLRFQGVTTTTPYTHDRGDEVCRMAVIEAQSRGQQTIRTSVTIQIHARPASQFSNICNRANNGTAYPDVTGSENINPNNSSNLTGLGTAGSPLRVLGNASWSTNLVQYAVTGGNYGQDDVATAEYIVGLAPGDNLMNVFQFVGSGTAGGTQNLRFNSGTALFFARGQKFELTVIIDDRQTFNSEYRHTLHLTVLAPLSVAHRPVSDDDNGNGTNDFPYRVVNGRALAQINPEGGDGTYSYEIISNPSSAYQISNTGELSHIAGAVLPTDNEEIEIRVSDEGTPASTDDLVIVVAPPLPFEAMHIPSSSDIDGAGTDGDPYIVSSIGQDIAGIQTSGGILPYFYEIISGHDTTSGGVTIITYDISNLGRLSHADVTLGVVRSILPVNNRGVSVRVTDSNVPPSTSTVDLVVKAADFMVEIEGVDNVAGDGSPGSPFLVSVRGQEIFRAIPSGGTGRYTFQLALNTRSAARYQVSNTGIVSHNCSTPLPMESEESGGAALRQPVQTVLRTLSGGDGLEIQHFPRVRGMPAADQSVGGCPP